MGEFFDDKAQVKNEDKKETILTLGRLGTLVDQLFGMVKQYVRSYNDKYYYHKGYINKMENELEDKIDNVQEKVTEEMYDKAYYVTPEYKYIESIDKYILKARVDENGNISNDPVELNINTDVNNTMLKEPGYRNVVYIPPCDSYIDPDSRKDIIIPYVLNQNNILEDRGAFGDGVRTIVRCGTDPTFTLGDNSYLRNLTLIKGTDGCKIELEGNNVEVADILASTDVDSRSGVAISFNGESSNVIIDNVQGDKVALTIAGAFAAKDVIIRNCTFNATLDVDLSGANLSSVKFENCIFEGNEYKSMDGSNMELTIENCVITGQLALNNLKNLVFNSNEVIDRAIIGVSNVRDIEICNNTVTGNGNVSVYNLSICKKMNISGNNYTNGAISVDGNNNVLLPGSDEELADNVLWSNNFNGISLMPICAVNNIDGEVVVRPNILKPGEAVIFNDEAIGTNPIDAIAIAYLNNDGQTVELRHPFQGLEAEAGRVEFMNNWEVSDMVSKTCRNFHLKDPDRYSPDIDPRYGSDIDPWQD